MSRPKNRRIDRPAQAGAESAPGAYIPLKSARMCAGCDAIFGKGHMKCPRCGSTAWFFVSNFVPSMTGDEEEQAVRASYQRDYSSITTVGELLAAKDDRFEDRPFDLAQYPRQSADSRPFIARLWTRAVSRFRPRTEVAL